MITTAIANLNTLGNPQLFKNPEGNEITLAQNATGINIVITPPLGYDATTTEGANASTVNAFTALGLIVEFGPSEIIITGDTLISSPLTTLNFVIRSTENNPLGVETIKVEILSPAFTFVQQPCEYCGTVTPISSQTTSQNFPIATRGIIEYRFVPVSGVEEPKALAGYNSVTSICFCGPASNLTIKSILTIRQIPHCGGTSPIVFQSISTQPIDIVDKNASAEFSADFACCVVKDKEFSIVPVSLELNNNFPHNTCSLTSLKYNLYDPNNNEVLLVHTKLGTITTLTTSKEITGIGTTFTNLIVGSKLYTSSGVEIGTVDTISSDTSLTIKENASIAITASPYQSNRFYYSNPTTSSDFDYTPTKLGTYKVVATVDNCCERLTKQWEINVCKSFIVETGTCNNPVIKNISAVNYLRITLTTHTEESLVDPTNEEEELYKGTLIPPLTQLKIGPLPDGFYILSTEEVFNGEVISEDAQVLFYDCNIKKCEIALTQKTLCFDFNCKNEYDYGKIMSERMKFQMYKDSIYSYWNSIKEQQSIPESWDIEDHLQNVGEYAELLKKLQGICTTCGLLDSNDCFKGVIRSVKNNNCTTCNK